MDAEKQITTLRSRLFSVALGVGLLLLSQLYEAGSTSRPALAEKSGISGGWLAEIYLGDVVFNKRQK